MLWMAIGQALGEGGGDLIGLWADKDVVHMAIRPASPNPLHHFDGAAERRFPSIGRFHPPALRLERAIRDLYGFSPVATPDQRPWLDHGAWGLRMPLGARSPARCATRQLRVPAGQGRRPAPDSRRAGACRHHRARAFPLHRQRRNRRAAGRAARLRPQGHRYAAHRCRDRAGRSAWSRASRAIPPSPMALLSRAPSRLRSRSSRRRAHSPARHHGRARARRQSFRRHRRDLQ